MTTTQTKNIAIIGGAVLIVVGAGFYINGQKKLITASDVKPVGVRFVSLRESILTLEIDLEITNYSNIQATVSEFYMDILINNTKVGAAIQKTPVYVPMHQKISTTIVTQVDVKQIYANIATLLLGGLQGKDISIVLDGYATVKNGLVTVNVPIDWESKLT